MKRAFHVYQPLHLSPVIACGCIGLGGDQGQKLAWRPATRKGTNNLIFLPYPLGNGRKADAKVPGVTTLLGLRVQFNSGHHEVE